MLVMVFGSLATTVASLIAIRPDLGRRLALAPPWIIHSVAAYIEFARNEEQSIDEIAADVATRHARDLLVMAVPNMHEHLATILGRIGDRVVDLAYYRRLNTVLRGPAASVILEAKEVRQSILQIAEWIAADPVMLAARHAIGLSEQDARALRLTLAYLRQNGLARDVETLPPNTGWRGIVRRISNDLGRAATVAPPFRLPPGWRAVGTLGDLWAVGRRMSNCVAGIRMTGNYHVRDIIGGKHVFITTTGEPIALATLRRVGENSWIVSEFEVMGSGHAGRQATLTTELAAVAAECGHTFYDECPLSTIRSLAWRRDGNKGDLDGDDLEDVA